MIPRDFTKDCDRILDWAKRNKFHAFAECPIPGCDKICHGFITNVQLHELMMTYTPRIVQLRKDGWKIQCVRGKGGVNTYHIIRKEDPLPITVQPKLTFGENLLFIGKFYGTEFFEVIA